VEWDSQVAHFATKFRCLNLDLPGHGESEIPPAANATLQFQVDAAAAFLASRNCAPVAAIGHSMGGRIAGWLALRYPRLIRALVLVNAPADQPLASGLKLLTKLTPTPVASFLMRRKHFFRGLTRRYSSDMVTTPNELTRRKAEHLRLMRRRTDFPRRMDFLIRLGKSILADDLARHLDEIESPTLIVWTENDHTCPGASAKLIEQRMPHARLEIIKDAAHNPHLEQFERFNEVLLQFLAITEMSRGS
jgi:pimeloyl-ACP methyl ester carboxylesterase